MLQNQDTMWKWIILMIDVDKNFIDIKEKTSSHDSNRRIQVIAFKCEEINTDGFSLFFFSKKISFLIPIFSNNKHFSGKSN